MKNAVSLKDTNILQLPDGRKLCYAEYGDPDGKPVILFHGNPNSRLLYGLIPDCPFRPGLHLIAPDRPGIDARTSACSLVSIEQTKAFH